MCNAAVTELLKDDLSPHYCPKDLEQQPEDEQGVVCKWFTWFDSCSFLFLTFWVIVFYMCDFYIYNICTVIVVIITGTPGKYDQKWLLKMYLHYLTFWSFIQKNCKNLTFHWNKRFETGVEITLRNMFFSKTR